MEFETEILKDETIRKALMRIIEYEEEEEKRIKSDPTLSKYNIKPWWEWQEVGIHWRTVHKLLLAGYLKVLGGRRKKYLLKDREAVKKLLEEYEKAEKIKTESTYSEEEKAVEIPPDFLDVVVGYDDLKRVILMSLKSDKPVHVLLEGPPGTAKSLILMEIERLKDSVFVVGGTSTKVGIRDMIFERSSPEPPGPRVLLIIDEIDKVDDPKDLSVLLTWMESGRVITTKHNVHEIRYSRGWVYAACNRSDRLPPELLDRFLPFKLKPYDRKTFIDVVKNVLIKREGKDEELARYIAIRVADNLGTLSVRDAIKIARLSKTKEDVDFLIRTLLKYS